LDLLPCFPPPPYTNAVRILIRCNSLNCTKCMKAAQRGVCSLWECRGSLFRFLRGVGWEGEHTLEAPLLYIYREAEVGFLTQQRATCEVSVILCLHRVAKPDRNLQAHCFVKVDSPVQPGDVNKRSPRDKIFTKKKKNWTLYRKFGGRYFEAN